MYSDVRYQYIDYHSIIVNIVIIIWLHHYVMCFRWVLDNKFLIHPSCLLITHTLRHRETLQHYYSYNNFVITVPSWLKSSAVLLKTMVTNDYVDSFHTFKISHHEYAQALIVHVHNLFHDAFISSFKVLSSLYHTCL